MDLLFATLAIIALFLATLIVWNYYKKTERLVKTLQKQLVETEQQLKIAEESYFTRKLTQPVFEHLLQEYKAQIIGIELQLSQLKGKKIINVTEKLNTLKAKIKNPTKAQAHRLEKLLTEAETIVSEINYLHNKLLKREIDEQLFNKMSEEKQKHIIKAEAKIRQMLNEENKQNKEQGEKTKQKPTETKKETAP